MTTDVFVCHPKDVLYPLWMWRMNKDRALFNKLFVVMTQQSDLRDYTSYLQNALIDATFITQFPYDGKDWRNSALQEAMKQSSADRFLFLEQDFLVADGFFDKLLSYDYDVIGIHDGNRLHPCCLLVTRKAFARTNGDFSVRRDVSDHFGRISVTLLEDCKDLIMLNLPPWYHMSGLTQNYRLHENFHHADEFLTYNDLCRKKLPMPQTWLTFTKRASNYKPSETIKQFFP